MERRKTTKLNKGMAIKRPLRKTHGITLDEQFTMISHFSMKTACVCTEIEDIVQQLAKLLAAKEENRGIYLLNALTDKLVAVELASQAISSVTYSYLGKNECDRQSQTEKSAILAPVKSEHQLQVQTSSRKSVLQITELTHDMNIDSVDDSPFNRDPLRETSEASTQTTFTEIEQRMAGVDKRATVGAPTALLTSNDPLMLDNYGQSFTTLISQLLLDADSLFSGHHAAEPDVVKEKTRRGNVTADGNLSTPKKKKTSAVGTPQARATRSKRSKAHSASSSTLTPLARSRTATPRRSSSRLMTPSNKK